MGIIIAPGLERQQPCHHRCAEQAVKRRIAIGVFKDNPFFREPQKCRCFDRWASVERQRTDGRLIRYTKNNV